MFDVCIVRTDDGLDWSDYLENVFTSPEEMKDKSGPYDVRIFSVGKDGSMQAVNQKIEDEDSISKQMATGKFLVVLVTPGLIKIMLEFRNLGFRDFDPILTRKAIFLCGIEPVQLFETDDNGRTLSERFIDYSSWTKYSHINYDKLVHSAVAWIRSADPVIPGRKDLDRREKNGPGERRGDDYSDDDNDDDYIFMQRPLSDDDKSSSKTSSKNIRDSDSSGELDAYIGKDSTRGERSTYFDSSDTYGIGRQFSLNCTVKKDSSFSLIPGEAVCEDKTTIVVVFKESPVGKPNSFGSGRKGPTFKVAMTDDSFTRHLELKWLNTTVAYFQAPTHHPGIVQVKIVKNNESIGGGVDLEYKRSQGVEELVSEVSQIYIHLLSMSFNLIKSSSMALPSGPGSSPSSLGSKRGSLSTSSSPMLQLDRSLSSVFRDSNDIDQFNVRAFEYFFTTFNSEDCSSLLPTALHLVAKHNLPNLASVLLGLPDSNLALAVQNSSKMTPVDLAKTSGHDEVTNLFEEFINSGSIPQELDSINQLKDEDQYIDMEGSKPKIKVTPADSNHNDDDEDDEPLKKGALDKSQEELINIMDLVKKKDISVSDAHTLFREWQLRHQNDEQEKTAKPEEILKSKGIKKTIGSWFGSGSKKSSSQTSIDSSARSSKRQISRSSDMNDNELPAIPPRISPSDMPQPPRRTNHNYLQLLDREDDDEAGYACRFDQGLQDDATDSSLRPPPRTKTRLKNAKQASFPAQLNPPVPHIVPRKCSLPESVNRKRMLQHFNSRLDSTTEASESCHNLDKERAGHGYISMTSKSKSPKN